MSRWKTKKQSWGKPTESHREEAGQLTWCMFWVRAILIKLLQDNAILHKTALRWYSSVQSSTEYFKTLSPYVTSVGYPLTRLEYCTPWAPIAAKVVERLLRVVHCLQVIPAIVAYPSAESTAQVVEVTRRDDHATPCCREHFHTVGSAIGARWSPAEASIQNEDTEKYI